MSDDQSDPFVAFGARLRKARDDAGLRTEDLATELYLSRESVDRYMRGSRKPSVQVVARWEELCGLPPGALTKAHAALPVKRAYRRSVGATASARVPTQGGEREPPAPPDEVAIAGSSEPDRRRWAAVAAGFLGAIVALGTVGFAAGRLLGEGEPGGSPAVSAEYAREMSAVRMRLDRVRVTQRKRLRSVATPARQADAARQLREGFDQALRTGASLRVAPREKAAHQRIIGALELTRDAYGSLALAAGRRNSSAFDRAAMLVKKGERDLVAAFDALRRLGYEFARRARAS
jgi:transcriptional regulator with XRE-family HTH domain